ncbi:MAG: tRNA 2-thiocytidine biosynthesis protein TtcA [Lachnospiraceae bacterium]|nr:tRNA 2-thiocytidine biosynthesis protein TtcA [Lachnospiraceae bacterium]
MDTFKQQESINDNVEKSIRKKFHKVLFSRFARAINEYRLLEEGDRVAVCISGGKDSMLMAKLFQELKKHNKFNFGLEFLVMDPGYNKENREALENNAKLLNIPVTIFETQIFDAVYEIDKSPCYLCARMRRGYLYNNAKKLGCNKIALGHHYDDVIETILMGMLYGAQVQTMMPKLHSTNFEGMELIRPMYLIREEDIIHWKEYNNLKFLQCACRFTENCASCGEDGAAGSKRIEVKTLIQSLKKINPYIESNIFRSVENVNLDTVIAYKEKGVRHSFLDNYNRD